MAAQDVRNEEEREREQMNEGDKELETTAGRLSRSRGGKKYAGDLEMRSLGGSLVPCEIVLSPGVPPLRERTKYKNGAWKETHLFLLLDCAVSLLRFLTYRVLSSYSLFLRSKTLKEMNKPGKRSHLFVGHLAGAGETA